MADGEPCFVQAERGAGGGFLSLLASAHSNGGTGLQGVVLAYVANRMAGCFQASAGDGEAGGRVGIGAALSIPLLQQGWICPC